MPSRAAHDALAHGTPLAALQAYSTFLNDRQDAGDVGFLQSLVVSGDRLACALAIRPLARHTGGEFDIALHAFARSDDLLLREQAVWALADRPPTSAGIEAIVGAIVDGGHAATLAQLTVEKWAALDPDVMGMIVAAIDHDVADDARVRLVESATVADTPSLPCS